MARRVVLFACALLFGILLGCSSGDGDGGGPIDLTDLTVPVGTTRSLDAEQVNVSGDAVINGTLNALADTMILNVAGDLTLNGRLEATDAADDPAPDGATRLGELPGIVLIVGGEVVIGPDAELETDGVTVITDSETTLDQTLDEANAEAESASGALPTLVPLPPDDPAFGRAVAAAAPASPGRQARRQVFLGGAWVGGPGAGVIFRFLLPDTDLNLDRTTVTVRSPAGQSDNDQTGDGEAGNDALGGKGRNGANLHIFNNSGSIRVLGGVTVNLPGGQAGQNAKAVCARAVGGEGGKPGNFRMTARDGIDLTGGTLTINPGAGGAGGRATVTGTTAAGGCPGQKGCDVTATGGKGGDNDKRLFTRGPVTGVENVSVGQVTGGAGGNANGTAGNGGPGDPCCDGGAGGAATATGGAGGKASFAFGTLPITFAGSTGGAGGDGTATGGNGGPGGDCKGAPGGDGGAGGAATATGGKGGDATGSPATTGGAGGDADAAGGNGGDGGDSTDTPGAGGAGAAGTATAGAGGSPGGAAGDATEADGNDGAPGELKAIIVAYCFDFGSVPDGEGAFSPGEFTADLVHPDTEAPLATMPIQLSVEGSGQLLRSMTPVKHIGIQGPGRLSFDCDQITPDAPPIVGLRIVPLFGNGISELNPLVVSYFGEGGQGNGAEPIVSIPDNRERLENPAFCELLFHLSPSIPGAGQVNINVPAGSFVTFLRIYLLDP